MKRTYIIETEGSALEVQWPLQVVGVRPIPKPEETLLAALRCDPRARAKFAESPRMLERLVAAVRASGD